MAWLRAAEPSANLSVTLKDLRQSVLNVVVVVSGVELSSWSSSGYGNPLACAHLDRIECMA
jgi:hypothetical protein